MGILEIAEREEPISTNEIPVFTRIIFTVGGAIHPHQMYTVC